MTFAPRWRTKVKLNERHINDCMMCNGWFHSRAYTEYSLTAPVSLPPHQSFDLEPPTSFPTGDFRLPVFILAEAPSRRELIKIIPCSASLQEGLRFRKTTYPLVEHLSGILCNILYQRYSVYHATQSETSGLIFSAF